MRPLFFHPICPNETVNRHVPEYISEKFAYTNSIHRHNLRSSQHNLFVPRPYTEAFKSFWYRGAVLWHSLSVKAKQATSSNNFLFQLISGGKVGY